MAQVELFDVQDHLTEQAMTLKIRTPYAMDEGETTRFDAHLGDCQRCRRRLEKVKRQQGKLLASSGTQ